MDIRPISAKGQVTVPIAIRKHLGIEPGASVRFVRRDGCVVLERVDTNFSALFGVLKARKGASLEQMKEAVASEAVERFNSR